MTGRSQVEVGRLELRISGVSPQAVQAALAGLGEALLPELARQLAAQAGASKQAGLPGRRTLERLDLRLDPGAAASPLALRQALVASLAGALVQAARGSANPGPAVQAGANPGGEQAAPDRRASGVPPQGAPGQKPPATST